MTATAVTAAAIILAAAAAVIYLFGQRKRNGCSGCNGCGNSCAGCGVRSDKTSKIPIRKLPVDKTGSG